MLGSLLGGIGSIVGGLLGGSSSSNTKVREKTRSRTHNISATRTRSNLGQMVRQAEKYGFNPLTVLRAGGLGAYASSATEGKAWTKSSTRGKNATSSSSSAPLAAGVAGAINSVGNALNQSATDPAMTAAEAFNATPTGAAAPSNDFALVMGQLAGSNWNQGQSTFNPTYLPSSNNASVDVPALTGIPIPTSRDGSSYKGYSEVIYDKNGDPIMPDDGKIGVVQPEVKGAEWTQFLPEDLVKNYNLKLPTKSLFSLEAGENVVGDDQAALPFAAYNAWQIARENAHAALPMARDALAFGAKANPFLEGANRVVNEWDPPAFQDAADPAGAIMEMSTDRQKVLFGDPALMSPTAYRQMMEQMTRSSY